MAAISSANFNLYSQFSTYRLMNAMNVQGVRKISKVGSLDSGSKTSQDYSKLFQRAGALSDDSLSFVQDYQRGMTEMMGAAQKLLSTSSSSSANQMQVTSSNSSVASASASWRPSEAASYELSVEQLAAAQVNHSTGIDLSGTDFSGELNIQTDAGTFQFQADASVSGNREALNSLVEQINKAKTGVTAGVTTVDGRASLTLTSNKTGESGAFAVSGSLATAKGLEDAAVQGQNAKYTVKKAGSSLPAREYTSDTNSVYVDSRFRIKADLKSTGSSTISVAPDTEKTAGAIQDLVNSFNSNLKLLNDNADRGEGVLKQMRRMIIPPTSEKSMAKAGVTINKDGTMNFDKAVYQKAVKENPSFVKDIVSGSYGLANGIYNDAKQGMNTSSRSLLSQDLKTAQLSSIYNPMNIMGTYSRNGAYNMSNFYAANVLMNLMV